MSGSIRVTSKRRGGLAALSGEIVVPIDRENPVLGNPHVLQNHRDNAERKHVVAAYNIDLEEDFSRKGPKYVACVAIAGDVRNGAKIALNCWCKQPRKEVLCHGDLLRSKIMALAGVEPPPPSSTNNAQMQLL